MDQKDKPKYPDAVVVDKENKEIGFSLDGSIFLNDQGENSLRKGSFDIPEGEKVSTKEGSMFTRFSLGSDLDSFIIDMSNKIGDKVDVDLDSAALRYKIGDNSNIYIENIGSDAPSIGYRFSKRFNEGGLNMSEEDQMQDMLVSNPEQGMAETVDPVSGNDVPPGSLPAEVRDDVPAQLSEGEYVVPADVVRYFGVKAFEDMRMQAKQGMADMDAEGRIGGDPMQEEALPFSDEELMTVDTPEDDTMAMMNEGGVVYAANGVDIPPGVIVDNPYGGGYGLDPNDPTQVVSGIQGGLTGTGYEYKTYYNAAGLTVVIPFFDGVAQAMIPEGYASEAPKAEVAPSSGSGGNDASDGFARAAKDRNTPDPVDYTKSKDPAELQKAIGSYYSRGNKLAKNLGFAINPLAGLGIYMVEKNNLKNIQSSVNALPDGEEKTNLELLLDKDKGKELRAETYETGGGFKSFLADIFGVGKDEVSDAEPSDNTPTYKYNTKYNTLSSDGAKIGGISLGSERDAYERAVESGDDNAVFHYEAIDSHRQRQNEYAASNEGKDPKDWTGGSGMSESSKEQAQKYGGSVAQARQGGSQRTGGAFSSFETSAQQTQREDEEDNGVPKNKGGLVQRPKKKKKNK